MKLYGVDKSKSLIIYFIFLCIQASKVNVITQIGFPHYLVFCSIMAIVLQWFYWISVYEDIHQIVIRLHFLNYIQFYILERYVSDMSEILSVQIILKYLAENYFRNLVTFCFYFWNTLDACTFDSIKKRSYNYLNMYCCLLLTKQLIHWIIYDLSVRF